MGQANDVWITPILSKGMCKNVTNFVIDLAQLTDNVHTYTFYCGKVYFLTSPACF